MGIDRWPMDGNSWKKPHIISENKKIISMRNAFEIQLIVDRMGLCIALVIYILWQIYILNVIIMKSFFASTFAVTQIHVYDTREINPNAMCNGTRKAASKICWTRDNDDWLIRHARIHRSVFLYSFTIDLDILTSQILIVRILSRSKGLIGMRAMLIQWEFGNYCSCRRPNLWSR